MKRGIGRVRCWEEGAGCRLMESRLPISPPPSFLAAAGLLNIQSTGCEEEGETGKNGADE